MMLFSWTHQAGAEDRLVINQFKDQGVLGQWCPGLREHMGGASA
jgi:hypothetical protein